MNYTEEQYDEFAARMHQNYPAMFENNRYGGFAVGAGWWHILDALCNQIHHHVKWKQQQKEKYNRGDGCPDVVVAQIKEKFGGLRFYYDGGDDVIDGMVRMAESWAGRTCEVCGNPGVARNGGWIKTLCDHHEAERQARYKERTDNEL